MAEDDQDDGLPDEDDLHVSEGEGDLAEDLLGEGDLHVAEGDLADDLPVEGDLSDDNDNV